LGFGTWDLSLVILPALFDSGHLELDIKMEDPKALAKPWVTTFYYENRPNWELGEISCSGDYLDWTAVEKGGKDYKR